MGRIMPAKNKSRTQIGKPEKAEIILLSLPLVALVAVVALLALPGKPAPAASPSTNSQNAALATPAVPTPTILATTAATTVPATTNSIPTAATTAASAAITTPAATTVAASLAQAKTIVAGSPTGAGQRFSKTVGGLKFDMLVSPGHIGDNTYDLVLSENGNQAVSDASLVRLTVTSLDMDMGVAQLDLVPAGQTEPGLYSGEDHKLQMLSMFGKYKVQVLVKRPTKDDITTAFEVSVTTS